MSDSTGFFVWKLLLPAASGFTCYFLLRMLLGSSAFAVKLALDHPNARSLHTEAKPRMGGVAMILSLTPALFLAGLPSIALPAIFLCLVSFFDDRYCLNAGVRLAAHALATLSFLHLTFPDLTGVTFFASMLGTMWMINLFNFMDGSDGLAGGMALIGFGFLSYAACLGSHPSLSVATLCVSACALAFLCFNFPPAKIFLGDSGSVPLGFLAASLALYGLNGGTWPAYFPAIVFSPFIVDASITLTKRILRREKIWCAHREHYYQRVILMGWSHRKTALAGYTLMFLCGILGALSISFPSASSIVLMFLMLSYAAFATLIDWAWAVHSKSNENPKT